jgi:hypothetical protein
VQDRKLATPPVVANGFHGQRVLRFIIFPPVQKLARDLIMAVCEHVRFDDHQFSNNALNRKLAGIDLRPHALDYDSTTSINSLFRHAGPPRLNMQSV